MNKNKIIALAMVATSMIQIIPAGATIVSGAKYYYTVGTLDNPVPEDPTELNGTLWDGTSKIDVPAPDTDAAVDITVKVVGIKDGVSSDVINTTVHFQEKVATVIQQPILDPSSSQTFSNRDTDNYFDIKNTSDTGVNYYYTTDGTTPSTTNGQLVSDKSFKLDGPNVDTKTTYQLKVIAEKDGVYSDVTSLRVTYSEKIGSTTDDTISDIVIKMSKAETYNRDSNVIAFFSNKNSKVTYYYTLDGTTPSAENGTKISSSYVKIPKQDTDEETSVIITVAGYNSSGLVGSEVSDITTFKSKESNMSIVQIKDKFNNTIETKEVKNGTSVVNVLEDVKAPALSGYTFSNWSVESGIVTSDMIIRAMYDKDLDIDSVVDSVNVQVLNKGSYGESSILVTGRKYRETVHVYTDSSKGTELASGTIDSNGECEMTHVTGLSDEGGSLYVTVTDPDTNVDYTPAVITTGSAVKARSLAVESLSVEKTTKVYYQPAYYYSSYSKAILPSRVYANKDNSALEVKGLTDGDVVKLYNIDNSLIGTGTVGSDGTISITVSGGLRYDAYYYVSNTTPGLLESPQTEVTLNDMIDNSIRDEENNVSNDSQSVTDVKNLISDILGNYEFNNGTTEDSLKKFLETVINNSDITITISDYNVDKATSDSTGKITGTVTITNTTDPSQNTNNVINIDSTINKVGGTSQTIGNAESEINEAINGIVPSPSTGKGDIEDILTDIISGTGITGTVDSFTNNGSSIKGTITITDGDTSKTINIDIPYIVDSVVIDESDDDELNDIAGEIKDYLDDLVPTNETSKGEVTDNLLDIVNNYPSTTSAAAVTIIGWDKTEATQSSNGLLHFVVKIVNSIKDTATVTFDKVISMLEKDDNTGSDNGTNNGTGNNTDKGNNENTNTDDNNHGNSGTDNGNGNNGNGNGGSTDSDTDTDTDSNTGNSGSSGSGNSGSSSGGHSSHHSSSSSSSSSSSGSSTSDTESGTTSTLGTVTNPIITDSSKTGTFNEGSTAIGTTNSATDSKGNTVGTIVNVTGSGTVKVSKSSNGEGSGSGSGVATQTVYKYEPVTGKYIELPEGFIVPNAVEVEFQAEANTNYFVSDLALDPTMVLQQGWNLVNGNNYRLDGIALRAGWIQDGDKWYFTNTTTLSQIKANWILVNDKWYHLDQDGVMQTGWIQDAGNWYFLEPWTGGGAMKTGWYQEGINWYWFNGSGAMQTGWRMVGADWYYFHSDGHMASSETIDGYTVDANGRWY